MSVQNVGKRIAVIGVILDDPQKDQESVNAIISQYSSIVRGRMGIPFALENASIVSLTVAGTVDEINSLTGKLGRIAGVSAGSSISKREFFFKEDLDES